MGARTHRQGVVAKTVPFFQQQQPLLLKIRQVHSLDRCQTVLRTDGGANAFAKEIAANNVGIVYWWADDRKVEIAGSQKVNKLGCNVLCDAKVHSRITGGEVAKVGCKEVRSN